ncbi:MAG: exosortase E/protease, VPEID-CTERM system [Myxococcales bacterium FL481]|nr:MAG: exosortase E/protease, VPEID-CTERM system [Myxococcales bacterium FL481]
MSHASRVWIVLATLGATYLAISYRYDVATAVGPARWLAWLGPTAPLLALIALSAVAISGRQIVTTLGTAAWPRPAWRLVGGLGFVAAAMGLDHLSQRLFATPGASIVDLVAWSLCGLATVGAALTAVWPWRVIARVARILGPALGVAAVVAGSAFAAGHATAQWWGPLGSWTLTTSYQVLSWVVPDAYVDVETATLGTDTFLVEIAPVCSGYEGIGVVFAFLCGVGIVFRHQLRFPAALLILPIGVGATLLANVARIVALILIGSWYSPEVAVGGFHSKAGWVLYSMLALTLVWLARSSAWMWQVPTAEPADARSGPRPDPSPYVAPLVAWIAIGLATGLGSVHIDWLYGLRPLLVGALLWRARATFVPPRDRWLDWRAVACGATAFAMWWWLVPGDAGRVQAALHELQSASSWQRGSWLAARLVGAGLVIPLVEELAFRGYLLRRFCAVDFESAALTWRRWVPIFASSLAFGFIHVQWVAGTLAGLIFAVAFLLRGRVWDAAVAHAVCNLLLALGVLLADRWAWWL